MALAFDLTARSRTPKQSGDVEQKFAGHLFARSIFRIIVHGVKKSEESKFLIARHRPNAKYPQNIFQPNSPFVRTYWTGIFRCVAEDLEALQNEGYFISAASNETFAPLIQTLDLFRARFDDPDGGELSDDQANELVASFSVTCDQLRSFIESSEDLLEQMVAYCLFVALRIFVSSNAGSNMIDALVDLRNSLQFGFEKMQAKLSKACNEFEESAPPSDRTFRIVRLAFEISTQMRVFMMGALDGLGRFQTEEVRILRRDILKSWTPDPLNGYIFGKLETQDSVKPLPVTPYLSNKVSFSIYDYDADYFYGWELSDEMWQNEFRDYVMDDSLFLSGLWPDMNDTQRLLLFPLLYRSASIGTVLLGDNFFGPALSFTIAKLFNNASIERLDLSRNDFDDQAAENLAVGLKMGGQNGSLSLISLDLRGNRITDAGAIRIIKALKFVPRLEHISFERNRIGDQTVAALISYLRDVQNTRLGNIDLSYNDEITYRGPHTLDRELKKDHGLAERDFCVNIKSLNWTDEDLAKLEGLDRRIHIS